MPINNMSCDLVYQVGRRIVETAEEDRRRTKSPGLM